MDGLERKEKRENRDCVETWVYLVQKEHMENEEGEVDMESHWLLRTVRLMRM